MIAGFFCDDHLVYKVWGASHLTHRITIGNGENIIHDFSDSSSGIASLDLGLITQHNCPALVDTIWDGDGHCRGYVTKRGRDVSRQDIPDSFIISLCEHFVDRGYALNDICEANVIILNGRPSLIDLDSPPSCLSAIDTRYDQEHGCLRAHQDSRYLAFMHRYLGLS